MQVRVIGVFLGERLVEQRVCLTRIEVLVVEDRLQMSDNALGQQDVNRLCFRIDKTQWVRPLFESPLLLLGEFDQGNILRLTLE